MKKIILLLALLAAPAARAHVELGTYQGTDADGRPCFVEIKGIRFDGPAQPLNERVEVSSQEWGFVLRHLPQIDAQQKFVGYEREVLTAAEGLQGGAVSAQLKIRHGAGYDGPSEFVLIRQVYRTPTQSTVWTCSELKIRPVHP